MVRTVPSDAVNVIPSGIVPMEIVTLESFLEMEKVPGSSSVKLKDAFDIEDTGVGAELPPPPPPHEARARAARLANIREDLPLS